MTLNIESYTRIDENAKISGVALIPRISRNHNLYTKEELRRFDGITVPLNWEHDGEKVIGQATFHYNQETETVYYEGDITDESAAILAKNRLLYTSIEATPISVKQICNGSNDCFHMPYGLRPEGLALTETPGVPETSVNIIENYILKECAYDKELEKKYAIKKPDQCVQTQTTKLTDEHPDWDDDKIRAGAMDTCKKSESIKMLDGLGILEALDLEYCEDCGKVKKKLNKSL